MRRRLIEPVALALLLLPALTPAASREIGPGDDVEGSIAALAPGDELVLRGGLYSLPSERFSVDLVASAELPIVIRSKDGERARLVRSNTDQNLIDFVRAEYLEIRNIEFEGGSAGLRFESGAHVTVEGCEISGTDDVALRANDAGETYVGFRILRNHIHDTDGTGEGMYLGCNEGGCSFNDALIEGNWVHHTNGASVTQGDGIEIKEGSGGNVVRDNVIHDTGYPCILVYSTRGRPQNVIERNLLFNCGDHAIQAAADAIIRNNVILGAKADGIAMQPHQSGTPQNLLVVHNTVLVAGGDAISVSGPTGPVIVANNAIYSESGMALVGGTSDFVTFEGNVGSGAGSVATLAAGSVGGDLESASFAGEPPMSLFPKAGSALIGAGAVARVADDDFNGTLRDGVADAGAYAYGTGSNPGWTLAAGFKGETPGGSEPGEGGSGGGSGGGNGGGTASEGESGASGGCSSSSSPDIAVAALLVAFALRPKRVTAWCPTWGRHTSPFGVAMAMAAAVAGMSSVLTGCGGSGGGSNGGSTGSSTGGSNGGWNGWVDRCPAYPSFPDANCTGPTSTDLPLYTGSLDLRTDSEVIEDVEMRIDRGLYVSADNVTFRNVKIVFTGTLDSDFTAVNLNYNSGTVFQDCEIDGQGNVARAIAGSGVTVRNCEIHHVGNAIETDTPLLVEGNYLHDIYETDGTDWHADGIQTPMSSDDITIRHNTVFGRHPSTSAINIMGTLADPATDVLIEHNLLAGGGYTVYAGPGSNYRVIDNHFSTQFYSSVGYYNIWYWAPSEDGDVTRSGNIIHETDAPANDNL